MAFFAQYEIDKYIVMRSAVQDVIMTNSFLTPQNIWMEVNGNMHRCQMYCYEQVYKALKHTDYVFIRKQYISKTKSRIL